MVDLRPDVEMMLEYLNAIFCEASSEGYLALRVFRDDKKDAPPIALRSVRFDDPTLSNQLQELGLLAANGEHPGVFCPPACAFKNGNGARTEDVAEGVVLVIELDENPTRGRRKLEKLLGKATLVNASGGEWLSPVTGNHEPKLHLHYRLKATTSTQVEHAKLSEARKLAATYAGGDPTAASIVHPIRIPGSWHVKDREHPRICYIIEKNPDIAIDLDGALAKLREACPQPRRPRGSGQPQAPIEDVEAALAVIPGTDDRAEWIRIGMAVYAATGGGEDGFRLFDAWSRKAPTKYGGTEKAWGSFARSPPGRIGFGTLFYEARRIDPEWRPPSWSAIDNPFSEDGMARTLAERQAARARFVPMWGRWLFWSGVTWRNDEKLESYTGARVVCRETARRAPKDGKSLASAKAVAAVVTLSRADPLLVTAPDDWAEDDWAFIAGR